jgi:hypothetical protein
MIVALSLPVLLFGFFVQWELTSENQPIARHEVVLINSKGEGIDRAITDNKGVVRFNIDQEANPVVFAATAFQEVAYISKGISTKTSGSGPHSFVVFPSTVSKNALKISELSIFFEILGKELIVHQNFWIENTSQNSVRASPEDGVFQFTVPSRAFDFRYGDGFQRGEVENRGNTVVVKSALYPGFTYFSFRYSVDSPRWSLSLPQRFSLPVERLSLLSNRPQIRFQEPQLSEAFEKFYAGDRRRVFVGSPGTSDFDVRLSRLPLNIPWTWWFPLALSSLMLLLALLPHQRESSATTSRALDDLLEEWIYLQRLHETNHIDERDYRLRKVDLVEQLLPYFDRELYENQRSSV